MINFDESWGMPMGSQRKITYNDRAYDDPPLTWGLKTDRGKKRSKIKNIFFSCFYISLESSRRDESNAHPLDPGSPLLNAEKVVQSRKNAIFCNFAFLCLTAYQSKALGELRSKMSLSLRKTSLSPFRVGKSRQKS
jgi:hypothetical protein